MDKLNENLCKDKAVEMRRAAETVRKARIFNTRLRVMGVSTDVLNQQVEEKRRLQEMERSREQAFGEAKSMESHPRCPLSSRVTLNSKM